LDWQQTPHLYGRKDNQPKIRKTARQKQEKIKPVKGKKQTRAKKKASEPRRASRESSDQRKCVKKTQHGDRTKKKGKTKKGQKMCCPGGGQNKGKSGDNQVGVGVHNLGGIRIRKRKTGSGSLGKGRIPCKKCRQGLGKGETGNRKICTQTARERSRTPELGGVHRQKNRTEKKEKGELQR